MNALLLFLLFLGTAAIQVFIGGMRPVFAIPAYLIIALAGATSIVLIRRNRPLPSLVCLGSSLIFFSYILWRAYHSPVEYISRPDRYMVLACVVVYLSFALYLTDPRTRLWLFYGLFLLALGHIAIGAIQFSKGENFLPFGYLRADYGRRASGFYVCPNHYAGLLEMLIMIAAAIGSWARVGLKTRMVVLYFAFMALGGLAISGSRGGYLSVAIALVVLATLSVFVVRLARPGKTLFVASAVASFILLTGLAGVGLMKKDILLSNRINAISDPKNMRLQLWEAALHQYRTQPATGTGAGTYFYLGRTFRAPSVQTDPVWVHNDYLHLLAEYGWLGAAACALFLGSHLWHGVLGLRQIIKKRLLEGGDMSSNALALNIGALAAIAAILAHSVVDFNVHIPGNALVLAALFGMLANPPTFRSRKVELSPHLALPFKLLIPVCAVAIAVDAAPHLRGEWYSEKARVALRDNRYLAAMRAAQLGLEVEKTNPDLHYYLGESRRLLGNSWSSEAARASMNDAAHNAFMDSIRLFPQDEKVWVKLSQSLDMLGRHEEAFASLEKARELDPNLAALNTYYAAHFQIQGDNKKALEYYQKAQESELNRKSRDALLRETQPDGAR
ncbi:MAG: O-antigen ligase family protein [Chthoniobacterales bacterium]